MPSQKKENNKNMSSGITKLQKENDELKKQVAEFSKQLETMREKMASIDEEPRSVEKSIQHFSDEYDDIRTFKDSLVYDISKMQTQLRTIEENVVKIEEAIEDINRYSYQYNVKILGVSKTNPKETPKETVDICVKLFNGIGATASKQDIDIAHRVTPRDPNKTPPIICKFTRRIAKEDVMNCKARLREINLDDIDLHAEGRVNIYDHLTPKSQLLFNRAKKFQADNNFKYCWTKNSTILLRESDESNVIKVVNQAVLDKYLSRTGSPEVGLFFDSNFPSGTMYSRGGRGGRGVFRPRRSTASYRQDP